MHSEPRYGQNLIDSLAGVEPAYLQSISKTLAMAKPPAGSSWTAALWNRYRSAAAPIDARFNAALVLASLDDASDQWVESDYEFLVECLVKANPIHQTTLWELLEKLRTRLLTPLETVFLDANRPQSAHVAAANAIALFAKDDHQRIANLLVAATPVQYEVLFPLIADAGPKIGKKFLSPWIMRQPPAALDELERVSLGRQRTAAAISLLRLDDIQATIDVMRIEDDPEALTQFIHRCRSRGVTTTQLLNCLDVIDRQRPTTTANERQHLNHALYGVLLSLGEFTFAEIPDSRRKSVTDRLAEWHADDPSSAVHGATGWLLRQWGLQDEATKVDQTPRPYSPDREWFTLAIDVAELPDGTAQEPPSKIFLTFVVYQPGEFQMGSADTEHNHEHKVTLTRPVAVSDREVTWAQFDPFDCGGKRYALANNKLKRLEPTLQDPAAVINWFEAASYCRWLSTMMEIDKSGQCYPAEPLVANDDDPGWVTLPDTTVWDVDLDGRGFRLPTDAEWEYVCRSGMNTTFSFGSDRELLSEYAWYDKNSKESYHPVGLRRPNHCGLFDLHGNLLEWCHDKWGGEHVDGAVDPVGPVEGSRRVVRGGGWNLPDSHSPSRHRGYALQMERTVLMGFRVVLFPSEIGHQPQTAEPSPEPHGP